MEEDNHSRLPTNISTTKNNTMPNTPQSSQIHGTSQQNQCAQHSAGRDILVSIMEKPTDNQTPATGTDGYTPHRDKGTQMPSQEIHTSTTNQSIQIPSQQRDLAITTVEDHKPKQNKSITPVTTAQNTSPESGIHQETYTDLPTQPPTPETEVNNAVESRRTIYTHSKPIVMKRNHNPIQIMDAMTTKDTRVQHRSKGSTPLSNTNPHLVHTNKQQYSLHQGLGQHYEETIAVNATSHTPISPGTTITNIWENQSEMSKPHLKPGEPQNTITIDGRDKSSHQEITILENDNRVSTLNDDTKFSVDLAQINNILANFLADTVQKMPWTPQQASANCIPGGNI